MKTYLQYTCIAFIALKHLKTLPFVLKVWDQDMVMVMRYTKEPAKQIYICIPLFALIILKR